MVSERVKSKICTLQVIKNGLDSVHVYITKRHFWANSISEDISVSTVKVKKNKKSGFDHSSRSDLRLGFVK